MNTRPGIDTANSPCRFIVLVAVSACGAAPPHVEVPRPKITVITAGAPDRLKIEYEFSTQDEGWEAKLKNRYRIDFTNTGLDNGTTIMDFPTIVQRGRASCSINGPDHGERVQFTISNSSVLSDTTSSILRTRIKNEMKSLSKPTESWLVERDGFASIKSGEQLLIRSLQIQYLDLFVWVVFPSTPIGDGARWEVLSVRNVKGVIWDRRDVFTLVKIQAPVVKLTLKRQLTARPGFQSGSSRRSAQLISATVAVDAEIDVDLTHIVPSIKAHSVSENNLSVINRDLRVSERISSEGDTAITPTSLNEIDHVAN